MATGKVEICSKGEEEILEQRNLPHDLITDHILTRLPIKSLLRFKSVSKHWYSSISSHRFANAQFKASPFVHPSSPTHGVFVHSGLFYYLYYYNDDDDDQESTIDAYYGRKGLVKLDVDFDISVDELCLVGSCNGLVCLASLSGDFIIWNPITWQWHKIIGPFRYSSKSKCRASWGFGYVSSVDDYKVVQIIEMLETLEILIHIFSLRNNKWRRIDNEVYENVVQLKETSTARVTLMNDDGYYRRYPISFWTDRGVLVDETLYWIVVRNDTIGKDIVAFSLVLETLDKFPHLDLRNTEVDTDKFLCVMGGCLSSYGVDMHDKVYIDTCKRPGEESWIRMFRHLNSVGWVDLIGFTKTDKFFVNYGRSFGLIDPSSWPMKYTRLMTCEREDEIHIANFVPSLISPSPIAAGLQEE